jgi:hypothetical protein
LNLKVCCVDLTSQVENVVVIFFVVCLSRGGPIKVDQKRISNPSIIEEEG